MGLHGEAGLGFPGPLRAEDPSDDADAADTALRPGLRRQPLQWLADAAGRRGSAGRARARAGRHRRAPDRHDLRRAHRCRGARAAAGGPFRYRRRRGRRRPGCAASMRTCPRTSRCAGSAGRRRFRRALRRARRRYRYLLHRCAGPPSAARAARRLDLSGRWTSSACASGSRAAGRRARLLRVPLGECQAASPVRRLERSTARARRVRGVRTVTGNAFLHHMVRNLVGALVWVGEGSGAPAWIADLLVGRDRRAARADLRGRRAVPDGVQYDERYGGLAPRRSDRLLRLIGRPAAADANPDQVLRAGSPWRPRRRSRAGCRCDRLRVLSEESAPARRRRRAALRRRLPSWVAAVGLFVNAPAGSIRRVAGAVGLDVIQFHGDEEPRACEGERPVGLAYWRAVRMRGPGRRFARILRPVSAAPRRFCWTALSAGYGGSGKRLRLVVGAARAARADRAVGRARCRQRRDGDRAAAPDDGRRVQRHPGRGAEARPARKEWNELHGRGSSPPTSNAPAARHEPPRTSANR